MSGSNHGHRTSAWRLVTVEIVTDFDCPNFDCTGFDCPDLFDCPDFVGTPNEPYYQLQKQPRGATP